MDYEKKLQSLGFTLPQPPKPLASYVPVVRTGNLLFLSGILPFVEGKLPVLGKVGTDLSLEEAQNAAKITLLNALSVLRAELGTLNAIEKFVRLSVHVASSPDFIQQATVANGASDLLVEVFGEIARHARLALGVAVLPLNAPVELEMIVEIATLGLRPGDDAPIVV